MFSNLIKILTLIRVCKIMAMKLKTFLFLKETVHDYLNVKLTVLKCASYILVYNVKGADPLKN